MKRYHSPRRACPSHESEMLATLCETLEILGWSCVRNPEDADLSVVWGWDRLVENQPTIFVERGWLPRWEYQVSPRGLNAESHVASGYSPRTTLDADGEAQRAATRNRLRELRETPCAEWPADFAYADPTVEPVPDETVPEEFILAPLQVDGDPNLRGRPYARTRDFVLSVSLADPPFPVLFKRHPAQAARGIVVESLRRGDRVVDHDPRVNVHAYLKHPGCRCVVTLNSNVAHDAILWNVPVVALARGVWPSHGPFWTTTPASWPGFFHYAAGQGMRDARLDYVAHLLREQWTTERAGEEREVEALAEAAFREVNGVVP